MVMKKTVCFFISCLLFCSCSSTYTDNDRFARSRSYDVGRRVDLSPAMPPSKIDSYDEYSNSYYFKIGECEWVYYVNKETKIVESWQYVSPPDKCLEKVDWFSGRPW